MLKSVQKRVLLLQSSHIKFGASVVLTMRAMISGGKVNKYIYSSTSCEHDADTSSPFKLILRTNSCLFTHPFLISTSS